MRKVASERVTGLAHQANLSSLSWVLSLVFHLTAVYMSPEYAIDGIFSMISDDSGFCMIVIRIIGKKGN